MNAIHETLIIYRTTIIKTIIIIKWIHEINIIIINIIIICNSIDFISISLIIHEYFFMF